MKSRARPVIALEYVSKTYGDDYLNYDQLVLRNVSLSISQGEFVIIFGPSGSGKSTMLNLIAGLERPTAGRVMVRSRDLNKFNDEELAKYHRLKMGMVFQNFNLIKSLNVWENVALPQTADGVPYERRKKRAKHLLKLFKLDQYMYRHPNEISGGEQQRVAIARALINNPLLLLVDEPTGNLDSKAAGDVMELLHGLHNHSKHTIILVTHNPDYLHYASRVIYVQDGEVSKQEYSMPDPEAVPKALPDEHFKALSQFKAEHNDDEEKATDAKAVAEEESDKEKADSHQPVTLMVDRPVDDKESTAKDKSDDTSEKEEPVNGPYAKAIGEYAIATEHIAPEHSAPEPVSFSSQPATPPTPALFGDHQPTDQKGEA